MEPTKYCMGERQNITRRKCGEGKPLKNNTPKENFVYYLYRLYTGLCGTDEWRKKKFHFLDKSFVLLYLYCRPVCSVTSSVRLLCRLWMAGVPIQLSVCFSHITLTSHFFSFWRIPTTLYFPDKTTHGHKHVLNIN